jgi:hypothetical protein
MTNSPQITPSSYAARIHLPSSVAVYFIVGPFCVVFGALLAALNVDQPFDWAVFPTTIGVSMLALGLALLTTALVVVGNRQLAQQQTDVLLRAVNGS